MRQLVATGLVGLLVLAGCLVLLVMRYQGDFVDEVRITADLTSTGDGLPHDADVKFRGVLVGSVKSVQVAALGENQHVDISLKPEYASDIPNTVTARVVPANIFAISAIELLDNGTSRGLRAGDTVRQDRSRDTVQLQTTLTTVRNVLAKIDPRKLGNILGTLSAGLDPSIRVPGSTVERLDHWVETVRASIPNFGSDLDNFSAAAHALNQSAPQLVTALGESVKVATTVASRQAELTDLLTGSGGTVDTVNALFARNPNTGKDITAGLNQTFGALAKDAGAIPKSIRNLDDALRRLDGTFRWGRSGQMIWQAGISLTPFMPYTRAECPRYGDLAGPSCATAPIFANPGVLPPALQRPNRPPLPPPPPPAAAATAPVPTAPLAQFPFLPAFPAVIPGGQPR